MASDPTVGGSPLSNMVRGQIVQESDGALKPPKNIIMTVAGAQAVYYHYRAEHLKRIELYAGIEGLIQGNPPYDPIELEQHGLSHITNVNNLTARAYYERSGQAYWNLINETESLIKVILRGKDRKLADIGNTIARHFSDVVRECSEFHVNMSTLSAQLVKFGIGPIVWPDERDWRWQSIELSRFFVADQASTQSNLLTCVFVESTFTVQFLFEIYEEYKDKPDDSPWNIKELERFLLQRANTWIKNNQQIIDMYDLQVRLQNGDVTFDQVFTDSVRLVHMLMREYDGKFSHYVFDRFYQNKDFLMFVDRQYKCLEEALLIITACPGEFTIHSNRGVGHKIYPGCQALMQMDCSIVDCGRWAATPLIKSPSTGYRDVDQVRIYPGAATNLGQADLVQNTVGENLQQLIGVGQYMKYGLDYNLANAGDDPGSPDRQLGSVSPSQARQMSYREFSISKMSIMHFYNFMDRAYRNMFVTMLKSKDGYPGYEYAEEWKRRCLEDGVPEEIFTATKVGYLGLPEQFKMVRAARVAGDGSTLARIMGLQELLPISGSFGARAQNAYKTEWVKATMGTEYVETFVEDPEGDSQESQGSTIAGLENAIMEAGKPPTFSLDNDHMAHLVTHMVIANDVVQRLQQQQMEPVQADPIFNVLVPHMEDHLKALEQNPFAQEFVKGISKAFNQLDEYARFNRKNAASQLQAQIQQRQQQAQKQEQVMSEEQLKTMQVVNEEKRKDYKTESQIQRSDRASDTRGEIMRKSAESAAENKRLQITLDAEAKRAESPLEQESLPELRQDLQNLNGRTISPVDIEST